MAKPIATDDVITLPIPGELAARFIREDASTPTASLPYRAMTACSCVAVKSSASPQPTACHRPSRRSMG